MSFLSFGIVAGLFLFVFLLYMAQLLRIGGKTRRGAKAMERGDLDAAERYFRKALRIARRLPNGFDSEVLAWLNLSLLAERRKMPEEAMRHAARAIKAMDGVKDGDNRFQLVFNHVAEMLEANGEFADAVQFRQYANSAVESARGKQAPELTLSLINLARALKQAGRPEEASSVFEKASKIYIPKTTPESVNIGAATMEMAMMLNRCGKQDEAEQKYREAIAIFKQAEGEEGINVSIAWTNLGVLYSDRERYEQALEAYENSLLIRCKRFGNGHPDVAWVQNNRAECLRKMGRAGDAEKVVKQAVDALRAAHHAKLPSALDTLGSTYLDRGQYSEAEAAFAEACSHLKAQPDHDPKRLCRYADRHAQALIHLGRDAEAERIKDEAARNAGKTNRRLAAILQERADAGAGDEDVRSRRSPTTASAEESLGEGPSLAARAMLAVALTIGFYALAFLCGGACGWIAWRMFEAHAYRAAFSFAAAAAAILIAILPRPDRFQAPGPQLLETEQPELFRMIEGIAQAAGEAMPAAVYLAAEQNAYVAERGGVWGFGARRIMGLGLPVIQSLTVDELRSVIAHEFGHYASGDTTFSSWIYTARAAVVRSVATLHAVNSLVHLPFKWYAQFFMRLTLRIARRQEFAADALAARLTSAAAAASALRTICSSRYDTFWSQELAPVLRCGLLPPITAGFEIFQRERCEDLEIQEERGSAYDTHPPLALRLGALSNLPANARFDVDARSAVALLRDLAKIERRMVEGQAGPPAGGWKLVDWRDCAAAVFVPYWETEVDKFADIFSFVQFKDVPSIVPDRVASRVGSEYQALAPEADRAYAQVLVGRAAGLALARDGWAGIGTPGDPVWFSKGSRRMNPSALVKDLWAGKLGDADWRKMASEAGVSNLPLTAAQSGALTDHRNFLPAPR